MRLFVEVMELNSFSATAEKMNISHSTVSKQINNLERDLNTRLIHRSTRKIRPTDAGLQFYHHCVNILKATETAWHSVNTSNTEPAGCLRISAPVSFARLYMGKVIYTVRKRFPELEIELHPDDSVVDLVQDDYDLTIRIGKLENSTCVARRIYTSSMVLCGSPEYIATYGEPKLLDDLDHHNCLTYKSSGSPSKWAFADRNTGKPLKKVVTGSFRTDNCDLLAQVALCGEGLIYIPHFVVDTYVQQGELVPVLPDYTGPDVPVYVVYPPGRYRPEKVRVFVDTLDFILNGTGVVDVITNTR